MKRRRYMKNVDIESIPQLVREAQLTHHEAAAALWEDIYRHPFQYGLGTLDDDDKSEFLLSVHKKLETLAVNFRPGTCRFRTYVGGYLKNAVKAWQRKKQLQATGDMLVSFAARQDYENAEENYMQRQEAPARIVPPNQRRKTRKRRIAEKTALILLMRACTDADDRLIANIARYTGTSGELLWDMVQRLKQTMAKKEHRRLLVRQRRDNAYYFHQKYALMLRKNTPGSSTYRSYQQRFAEHTNRWKKWNEKLSHRLLCSPSNATIAAELGMTPRQVYFYINHAMNKHAVHWDCDEDNGDMMD